MSTNQTTEFNFDREDIDYEWRLDFSGGHIDYGGSDVQAYADKISKFLNKQVDVYRLDYAFTITPTKENI